MIETLSYLLYVPTAVMFAAGFAILWRCRRRSRIGTVLAFAGLCGLAGLWLFVQFFHMISKPWQEGLTAQEMSKFYTLFSLVYVCWDSACILLLVVAVVIDRRSPTPRLDNVSSPVADFDEPAIARPQH